MTGNPLAGMARIGWMEFRSHLKSPRLIVLVVLFALLVFGIAYGMTSPSSGGPSYVSNRLFVHPALVNESGSIHYLVVAFFCDSAGVPQKSVAVSLYENIYDQLNMTSKRTLVEEKSTNETGFVSFDLGTSVSMSVYYDVQTSANQASGVGFYPELANETFTAYADTIPSYGPMGSSTMAYVHVLALNGTPAMGAQIYLNDTLVGHPDSNGFYLFEVSQGPHRLNITYDGQSQASMIFGYPSIGPAFTSGGDTFLMTLAQSFMTLMLPIIGLAIAFDAFARERAQGSLEILLSRRVRREGIVLGKFLGSFVSIALPVLAVILTGTAFISYASGHPPDATFAAVVVIGALFLVAVFVSLTILFSTLAKSVATAVVFSVVVWLFFALIFTSLLFFFAYSMLFSGPADPGFYSTVAAWMLLNPTMIFQNLAYLAYPYTAQNGLGLVPPQFLSAPALVAAGVLWIAIPLILTILVFRKKAES